MSSTNDIGVRNLLGLIASSGDFRMRIAGWIVASTFVLGVLKTLFPFPPLAWFGLGYWLAALLLLTSMKIHRKKLSTFLFVGGMICLVIALYRGARLQIPLPLATNSQIISLLVAATLLSQLGRMREATSAVLPTGMGAILKTTLAVHFIGAVINLSAVYLLGDRMTRQKAMDGRQALILTRGFAAAGFWSPLFITMAVALKYAPGSSPTTLFLFGFGMAGAALLLTFYEVVRMGNPADFIGYPLNKGTLWLPLLLVACISILHFAVPEMSPLEAISLLVATVYLICFAARPKQSAPILHRQIQQDFPQLASEIVLFIAAGMFSLGLSLLLGTFAEWKPFQQFSFTEASLCFIAIVLLAQIGLHPIASISFVGPMIANVSANPNLAASVFIYAWALSSAINPLSSQNLGTFTRYQIDSSKIRFSNMRYGLIMSILIILLFYILSHLPTLL